MLFSKILRNRSCNFPQYFIFIQTFHDKRLFFNSLPNKKSHQYMFAHSTAICAAHNGTNGQILTTFSCISCHFCPANFRSQLRLETVQGFGWVTRYQPFPPYLKEVTTSPEKQTKKQRTKPKSAAECFGVESRHF